MVVRIAECEVRWQGTSKDSGVQGERVSGHFCGVLTWVEQRVRDILVSNVGGEGAAGYMTQHWHHSLMYNESG